MKHIVNSSMIMAQYVPPTNSKGAKIKLWTWDLSHYNNDKTCRKFLSWDYSSSDISEQVQNLAAKHGLKLRAFNGRGDCYVFLFDWNIEAMAEIFGYVAEVKETMGRAE